MTGSTSKLYPTTSIAPQTQHIARPQPPHNITSPKKKATPAKPAQEDPPATITNSRDKEVATTAATARPRRESAVTPQATPSAKKATKPKGN